MKTELVKKLSIGTGIKLCHAFLSFFNTFLIAKLFGSDVLGSFAFVVALATTGAVFCRFGFHVYFVFKINKLRSEGLDNHVASVIAAGILTVIFLSGLFGTILMFVGEFWPTWIFSEFMYLVMSLTITIALIQLTSGVFQSFGKINTGLSLDSLFRPGCFLVCTLGLVSYSPSGGVSAHTVLFIYLFSNFAVLLIFGIFASHVVRNEVGLHSIKIARMLPSIIEAKAFVLANALSHMYQSVGVLVVGVFYQPLEVGLYKIASQLASLTVVGLHAVQAVMSPRIARSLNVGGDGITGIQGQVTFITRFLAIIVIPVALIMLFNSREILGFFGDDYKSASYLLIVLTFGQCVSLFCGLNGVVINMAGKAEINAKWSLVAFCVCLILFIPSIFWFGLIGIAFSECMSRIVWNIGLVNAAYSCTGLNTSVLSNRILSKLNGA